MIVRDTPLQYPLQGADAVATAAPALAAAVLGFFVITLDAVVVSVALPSIRRDFGGGITGLQWVVDGYTLMFAALLLSAGAFSDRIGARRAFVAGFVLFITASAVCGVAPSLGALVLARFLQGTAAAAMMPTSMALISQAFPDPARRARGCALGDGCRGSLFLRSGARRLPDSDLLAADLLHQPACRRAGAPVADADRTIAAPIGPI